MSDITGRICVCGCVDERHEVAQPHPCYDCNCQEFESVSVRPQGDYLSRRLRDLIQNLETHIRGYLEGELTGPQVITGVAEVGLAIQKVIARDHLRRQERRQIRRTG